MKILFAVSGEGYGHATRSKALIDYLQKNHTITVAGGGKAYEYLSKHYPVLEISCLRIIYKHNKVSNLWSTITNIRNIPNHVKTVKKLNSLIRTWKPDLILNDFEIFTNYVGWLSRIPVVTIDNENIVTRTKINVPLRHFISYAKVWLVTRLISPKANRHIIPTFFYPEKTAADVTLIHPIIRHDVLHLKPKTGKHLLVYQTSATNQELLLLLKKTTHSCIIYGFGQKTKEKNLTFKNFNEDRFFHDLATADAVIANGGFSLMTEALYLKKPLLALPITGQFEQVLNAHYLDTLGYGMTGATTPATIRTFLKNKERYRKLLQKTALHVNDFQLIEKIIKEAYETRNKSPHHRT